MSSRQTRPRRLGSWWSTNSTTAGPAGDDPVDAMPVQRLRPSLTQRVRRSMPVHCRESAERRGMALVPLRHRRSFSWVIATVRGRPASFVRPTATDVAARSRRDPVCQGRRETSRPGACPRPSSDVTDPSRGRGRRRSVHHPSRPSGYRTCATDCTGESARTRRSSLRSGVRSLGSSHRARPREGRQHGQHSHRHQALSPAAAWRARASPTADRAHGRGGRDVAHPRVRAGRFRQDHRPGFLAVARLDAAADDCVRLTGRVRQPGRLVLALRRDRSELRGTRRRREHSPAALRRSARDPDAADGGPQ